MYIFHGWIDERFNGSLFILLWRSTSLSFRCLNRTKNHFIWILIVITHKWKWNKYLNVNFLDKLLVITRLTFLLTCWAGADTYWANQRSACVMTSLQEPTSNTKQIKIKTWKGCLEIKMCCSSCYVLHVGYMHTNKTLIHYLTLLT